ncbi:hypothetical protein [Saccharopolyspora gregorii]|uniref:hypothetical protein n=1 Tax=Saccharopolyspora gregorii TaxID=33914 RepID=UPI0031E8B7A4
MTDFDTLRERALAFREELLARKEKIAPAEFDWYPYDTMANIFHLDRLLTGPQRQVFDRIAGSRIADIGAADGDFGFFLEHELGCSVDVVDNPPTNFNGLRGRGGARRGAVLRGAGARDRPRLAVRAARAALRGGVLPGAALPPEEPVLRAGGAGPAGRAVLPVHPGRAAGTGRHAAAGAAGGVPAGPGGANDDATNFWIFSEIGLKRLFARTGWEVVEFTTVGCADGSEPARADRDERAFALLRSTKV